jgi:hypothetical protein
MKIRFEKVELEVSPQFVEHVTKVFIELETLQARMRDARVREAASSRMNLIATVASMGIQLLREAIDSMKASKTDEDGDGDDAPGAEGGGDAGPAQPT